jgi:hypothetical protein
MTFHELVRYMVKSDLKLVEKELALREKGFRTERRFE